MNRAVDTYPESENIHRLLMTTLAEEGRFAEALHVYQELREYLQTLLASPQPATTDLYTHLSERARTLRRPPYAPKGAGRRTHRESDTSEEERHSPTISSPLTPLVGRDAEMQTISALVLSKRLVTLTGIGGIGKTRLATEAAIQLAPVFPGGVYMATLDTLTDSTLLAQQVARILHVTISQSQNWTEALISFFQRRQCLLVLDNCEHLLTACADLARVLLRACPHLHLLATSRERLGLMGEVVYSVPALTWPQEATACADWRQCLEMPAVHLFCERAQSARPDFTPSAHNMAGVVQICRLVDGIPLALELAAALIETFSIADIAERLNTSIQLLNDGDPTAPERHQSLSATLEWSYRRLPETHRSLLSHLTVFSGDWDLPAVQTVIPTVSESAEGFDSMLRRLVSCSLVLSVNDGNRRRYRLLDIVCKYVREQNAPDTKVFQRHCAYYCALAEEAERHLIGGEQAEWLSMLDRENANLRAALDWATWKCENPNLVFRFGAALLRFWYARNYCDEGQQRLRSILHRYGSGDSLPPELRLKLIKGLGNLCYAGGQYPEARASFSECLSLAPEIMDERAQTQARASALASLANVELRERDYGQARLHFQEALHHFAAIRDARGEALTYSNLAMLACECDRDYVTARELHEKALLRFREMEALMNIGLECSNLAWTLMHLGDYAGAQRCSAGKLRTQ